MNFLDSTGTILSRRIRCKMWLVSCRNLFRSFFLAEVVFKDFPDKRAFLSDAAGKRWIWMLKQFYPEMLRVICLNYDLTGLLQRGWEGTSVFGLMLSNLDRASSSICFRCCSKGKSPYVKNLKNQLKTLSGVSVKDYFEKRVKPLVPSSPLNCWQKSTTW